jgi:hypothetical protein
MFLSKGIAVVLALCAGGCAIHPLPDDAISAGRDTVSIVRHIRCEARLAVKLAIADYFQNPEQFASGSPTARIGERLRSGAIPLGKLNRYLRLVDRGAAANVLRYEGVAVGYDFSFDMTEDNAYSTQVNLLQTLTGGTAGLGLKAGSDFQRQTVRIFRVQDSFGELMTKLDEEDCPEDSAVDYIYPVRGNIGIGEMVKTFVQLNESENLTGAKDGDKVPVLSDTFNFQTMLSGSTTPTVTLLPVGHRFGLADANIVAAGSRKDIHKVIVAMSLPIRKGQAFVGGVGIFSGASARPPASARERVNRALDEQINRSILNQLSIPR